jgi:hypothetical protein
MRNFDPAYGPEWVNSLHYRAAAILSASPQLAESNRAAKRFRVVPCMDGARGAREKNLTSQRNVRVQPCIRPLSAAAVAAGPDVIH